MQFAPKMKFKQFSVGETVGTESCSSCPDRSSGSKSGVESFFKCEVNAIRLSVVCCRINIRWSCVLKHVCDESNTCDILNNWLLIASTSSLKHE